MSDVRFAVGSRGPVIESISRRIFTKCQTLFKNMLVFPEIQHFILTLDEVHIG